MMPAARIRTITILCALLLATAPTLRAEGAWQLSALMASLAQSSHTKVRFREERALRYLDDTLVSEGYMSVDKQGQLLKEISKPRYERLLVTEQTVQVSREGGEEVRISLGDYPLLLGFIEAFRATLLGDQETLLRHYRHELQGAAKGWQLRLYPLQAELARVIEVIEIDGQQGMAQRFRILEPGGDHTTITITALSQ